MRRRIKWRWVPFVVAVELLGILSQAFLCAHLSSNKLYWRLRKYYDARLS